MEKLLSQNQEHLTETLHNLDIKNLNTKVFRLRFNVSGKLYSFGFADKNGNAGGARAAGEVNAHS